MQPRAWIQSHAQLRFAELSGAAAAIPRPYCLSLSDQYTQELIIMDCFLFKLRKRLGRQAPKVTQGGEREGLTRSGRDQEKIKLKKGEEEEKTWEWIASRMKDALKKDNLGIRMRGNKIEGKWQPLL